MFKKKEKGLKKIHILFIVVFFVSAVALALWQNFYKSEAVISLKGDDLKVIVADSPTKQFKGLSSREDLGEYDGMLFVFPYKDRLGVVMRDMNFSIDIVWFDGGQVVDFASNVPLEPGVAERDLHVYYPRADANLFLELPAGWANTHNLKIGDKLSIVE